MSDQHKLSDLYALRDDVESALRAPALEDLVAVAQSRQRTRLALAAVAAVAAVAVVAALSMTGGGGGRALVPATNPTSAAGPVVTASALPSTLPAPWTPPAPDGRWRGDAAAGWTASDIIEHPEAVVLWSIDAGDTPYRMPGVRGEDADGAVIAWHRCGNPATTVYVSDCTDRSAVILEVRSDDPALPRLVIDPFTAYPSDVRYVGNGTFYISGPGSEPLLAKAGWQRPLPLGRAAIPVEPTPGVTVPCYWPETANGVCILDVSRQLLTVVEVPRYESSSWSSQSRDGFWGVARRNTEGGSGDRIVVQRTDGTFEEFVLPGYDRYVVPTGVPEGVMAVFSQPVSDQPAGWHNLPILGVLHVSTDQGRTWSTYAVPKGLNGSLDPTRYVTYLPSLPADWTTWPRVV